MNTSTFAKLLLRDLVQRSPVTLRADGETPDDHQSAKSFADFIEGEILKGVPASKVRAAGATTSDTAERLVGASMSAASGNTFRFSRSLPPQTRGRRAEPVELV